MFNANAKALGRLAPRLQRILIVESTPAAGRLLADLMKEMGGRQILFASTQARAIGLIEEAEPQLIFTEYAGPQFDGLELTLALRRSQMLARKNPVIMVTAEATAASIIASRNAGVHEFLRKPFTAGDLFRRVDNVITKPRDWIEAQMYIGPDRRRFNAGEYAGSKKRRGELAKPPEVSAA